MTTLVKCCILKISINSRAYLEKVFFMHETHLIKNILKYLEGEEGKSCRRVKKICMTLSEFSSISEEHFRQHYKDASVGTRWESLDIEIKKIPYGQVFEITKIEFA